MQTITLTQPGTYVYTLDQEGSELKVTGAFWLKNQDQFELNVTIIHAAPRTTAYTDLRAVVDDAATAHLNGSIIVKPKAQLTNSYLNEKILLLSPQAKATAIPNLEIQANEVKCSHAASVGPIDPEQLFYLQSRGLDEKTS